LIACVNAKENQLLDSSNKKVKEEKIKLEVKSVTNVGWCWYCTLANWRQLADWTVPDAAYSVPEWGKQGRLLSAVRRTEDC